MTNWEKHREEIVRLYSSGLSLRHIAAKFGTTHATINKYLARWNIPRRSGVNRRRKNVKDLVGKRFGFLTVLAQDLSKYPTHWICKCVCNRRVSVSRVKLMRGWKKSCGCRQRRRSKNAKSNI